MPVFSRRRLTTVRQRLLTSSLSEQKPIFVCPSPIVYLPADTPSNCSSSACARGQLPYQQTNLVNVGAGEVDVHGEDANILGPTMADPVCHIVVGHPASLACNWRLWTGPGGELPGGLLPFLGSLSCYRSFPALPGLYSYTGGELVVGKSWLRLRGVRWLRKALT